MKTTIIFLFGATLALAINLFWGAIKIDAPVFWCENKDKNTIVCHKKFPNTVNDYFMVQKISR